MKATYKTTAVILAAAMMIGAAGCTKKTAVDGTSDASATDANGNPIEAVVSGMSTDGSSGTAEATETEFDINDYTFDTLYGSQLPDYVNRQYYFNGEEVPTAESNFYFINAYIELSEYASYGYYPMNEDGFLDLEASIDYGDEEAGKYATYSEFFTEYSERMLASTCTICKLAREQGLELSQETLDSIDQMIDNLRVENAEENGVTLDEYLRLYYGDGCDAEAFRQVMINYYLADLFTTKYIENYQVPVDQAGDYTYPVIRYALFSAPIDSASEEELAAAQAYAEALVEAAEGDIDTFYNLGQAAYEEGTCAQCYEITVPVGRTVQAFEDWAWDPARTEGELGVIYSPEYGYFAVGYVGSQIDSDSASDLAVGALGDYVSSLIGTEGYFLSTDPDAVAETPAPSEPSESEDEGETEAGETEAETEAAA